MSSTSVPGWQTLLALGLPVGWSTLREGLRGVALERRLLTVGDVAAWAARVVDADPDQPDAVFALLAIPPGTGNDRDSLAEADLLLERLTRDERADPALDQRAWRLTEIAALTERIATWPSSDDIDPACQVWSACREVWLPWAALDRPPLFFTATGAEVSCYCGRPLASVLADYRAWLTTEGDRIRGSRSS